MGAAGSKTHPLSSRVSGRLRGWRAGLVLLVAVAPALFLGKMPIIDLLDNDPDPINYDGADDRNAE
jgi:hypothetical protein